MYGCYYALVRTHYRRETATSPPADYTVAAYKKSRILREEERTRSSRNKTENIAD